MIKYERWMKQDEDDEEEEEEEGEDSEAARDIQLLPNLQLPPSTIAVPPSITGHGGHHGSCSGPFLDLLDTDCSKSHSSLQAAIIFNLLGHRRCCMWSSPWLPSTGTAASPQQSRCGEGLPGAELQPNWGFFWTTSRGIAHRGAPVADHE